MTPRSTTSLALVSLLLVGCGTATSTPTADDPEQTPSTTPSTSSTPSPVTPSATRDLLTVIPEDIQLDVAMPRPSSEITVRAYDVEADSAPLDLCGPVPLGIDRVDLAGVTASGPEYAESRDLRLYETVEAATDVMALVTSRLSHCIEQLPPGGDRILERRGSALAGDEALTIVETYQYDGLPTLGATFHELVRIGNALLVTRSYGEWEPTTNLDGGIETHAREVTPIVEAMCDFAAEPC